ncbi:MAG: hypothetical protein ACKOZW_05325, partial [Cyanobium sp.]
GVSLLAHRLQPFPSEEQTVFSQMGLLVFGEGSILYIVLQFATAAILVLDSVAACCSRSGRREPAR